MKIVLGILVLLLGGFFLLKSSPDSTTPKIEEEKPIETPEEEIRPKERVSPPRKRREFSPSNEERNERIQEYNPSPSSEELEPRNSIDAPPPMPENFNNEEEIEVPEPIEQPHFNEEIERREDQVQEFEPIEDAPDSYEDEDQPQEEF